MGFENFGMVSFTAESKTADFMTYLEEGKVMTTRCKDCGTAIFPPKMDCPSCPGSEIEWFEVSGPGKLLTFSTVHYGPSGFEEDAPYTIAVAEFEGGLRMFGRLSKTVAVENIKIGMAVKVIPSKLGEEKLGYEFVAV